MKAYKVQVTDQQEVEKITDKCVEELGGRLDVFVANAGIPWTKGGILDAADVSPHPPRAPRSPCLISTSRTNPR